MPARISAEDRLKRIPKIPRLSYCRLMVHRRVGFKEVWSRLDWTAARIDPGPSPAGNPGPYYHVPYPKEGTVHRLYPKRFALRMSEAELRKVRA